MSIACVIVAAGRGERCGLGYNKVFFPLAGRTVLAHCVDAVYLSGLVDQIALVVSRDDIEAYRAVSENDSAFRAVTALAYGGDTRQQSVYNGLMALNAQPDIVLIHDGARPFVTRKIISDVIDDARAYGSGVVATRVTDTVKHVTGDGFADGTLPREALAQVQTPQAFRYAEIVKAHQTALSDGYTATDDAALYEHAYGRVRITYTEDASKNMKITNPDDLARAENRLNRVLPRVGTGYDVHRLTINRKLILCGVEIPYEKGLDGHSDADVALHALMDAMLGAAALSDIGAQFPDTDPEYAGISSVTLLGRARDILASAGWRVYNADITIVAQKPKLMPYREQMRKSVADTLGLAVSSVSVKATTTEGLGFEGEGLGISAQAVVTIVWKGMAV